MGDVQYLWADPGNAQQQVALSSIVRAMKGDEAGKEKELYAIARWITKDGSDPKMGVLSPSIFENVDCLLWTQARHFFAPPVIFLWHRLLSDALC